ncbi:Bacteriophage CI repressor helix-turn-helix domain [Serratia quinivorans]|jgi:transcriptional regulator with XRE-family HTH domain|uniref:helix-turn-helix domain-containing protein n=1 Tax=Serratia quinivorans TaxID=137545 RepID=UPI00217A261F|nr:helix-turn-helix domain-containing protein [Serratia quinivorans]CAI1087426.1 Bacteriophage CI repressor helix-turn-helix domain [Serratia quinivorans]CAI1125810.1 Bacteriophage CI repressor helix-turn-helix domain [Serratia quinivorans]CAI1198189.1 Bacteriophage CI repressor helix-turn-helix domain [Serratia quinivorans]CAI1832135.1 Bacteriophage CI repressor helix-turn-helix domain [Serratia quinivorans]CAI1925066.1 Bacteriophage CI repressor helix-turn-helix domain [Serratia quinivorans]
MQILILIGDDMREETVNDNASVGAVIERILSSYGVGTQKELSEILGIAPNNISSWQQRGSVPGYVIISCALATGADLAWLMTGELAKAKNERKPIQPAQGKALYDRVLASGGKGVLRRILDAYGFSLQKELGDLLGISSGTMSTWVRRNYFPGDIVVTCALDTGVSLLWLATGQGEMGSGSTAVAVPTGGRALPKYRLVAGQLKDAGEWLADGSLIPAGVAQPAYVDGGRLSWLVDLAVTHIANGRWLIDIDGNIDVYDIARLPGNQVQVSGGNADFQCSTDALKALGMVWLTLTPQA